MSFNKITIIGNLGRDPELRYTPQGTAVCNFSIATNEKRRDKSGEQQDITTWFKVTTWGKQAENANKYLKKGSSVYIEGRLRLDEWTDRDGNTRQTLDVNASEMQFLSGGTRSTENAEAKQSESANEFSDAATSEVSEKSQAADDEIPF